jgi:hypothetical protein
VPLLLLVLVLLRGGEGGEGRGGEAGGMAGKADDDDADEEERPVRWRVANGSSEAEVHPATNVLRPDRFRVWQTGLPCEEAWLVLEPRPPSAFCAVEVVNAGSALVELFGLRDGGEGDDYELLLSPQQVGRFFLLSLPSFSV